MLLCMKELVNIQKSLKAPKNQYNKFGNYYYRNAEDILEAVKPLLYKEECILTISDDVVAVADRIYVKATVTLANKEGQMVSTSALAREEENKKGMDAAQITGAASSYARKYALNGLFCIDDNKDPDTFQPKEEELDIQAITKEVENCQDKATLSSVWKKYEKKDKEGKIKAIVVKRMNELGICKN